MATEAEKLLKKYEEYFRIIIEGSEEEKDDLYYDTETTWFGKISKLFTRKELWELWMFFMLKELIKDQTKIIKSQARLWQTRDSLKKNVKNI
jgi:hypothetical protein